MAKTEELKHMNAKVNAKLYLSSRKRMKKNGHKLRDVVHAALAAYKKDELTVIATPRRKAKAS